MPAAREIAVVALGAAAREALRLADVLEAMLLGARDAFATAIASGSAKPSAWTTCSTG